MPNRTAAVLLLLALGGPAFGQPYYVAPARWDNHSFVADARFVDPATGDYRVKEGSPALALGFVNFPMDQFGVQKPTPKTIARAPVLPGQ